MALTAEQYQALILAELGDDATLAAQLSTLWELAEGGGALIDRYRRAKLAGVELLLARAAGQVSFKALDGASVDLSDRFAHLLQLRDQLRAELAVAEGAAGGYGVGEITTQAPLSAPPAPTTTPDPNARALRGDPLAPPRGGFRP